MINQRDNGVAWANLLVELDDAREHLESLLEEMNAVGTIDESDFASDLGHIYAHLNLAWHCRNSGEIKQEQRGELSSFPKDLEPVA